MYVTSVLGLLGVIASNSSVALQAPMPGVDKAAYKLYLDAYERARVGRDELLGVVKEVVIKSRSLTLPGLDVGASQTLVSVGNAAMYVSDVVDKVKDGVSSGVDCVMQPSECSGRARRRRKARELKKQRAGASGSSASEGGGVANDQSSSVEQGRNGKPVVPGTVGFWRSVGDKTRAELMETKAQMHIAENRRKTKEAENQFLYLSSPQAIVQQAVKFAEKAEKFGAKSAGSPVYGYAQTVSTHSAESLVKSLGSITSYEDFANRKIEDEWRAKLDEVCQDNKRKDEQLSTLQLEFAKKVASSDSDLVAENEKLLKNAKLVAEKILQLEKKLFHLEKAGSVRLDAQTCRVPAQQFGESDTAYIFRLKYESPAGAYEAWLERKSVYDT